MNCDFRFPPRCIWDRPPFEVSLSVDWQFLTEFSGKPIGPIFINKAAHDDCLSLAEQHDKEERARKLKKVTYLWFNILMYGHPLAIGMLSFSGNEA